MSLIPQELKIWDSTVEVCENQGMVRGLDVQHKMFILSPESGCHIRRIQRVVAGIKKSDRLD